MSLNKSLLLAGLLSFTPAFTIPANPEPTKDAPTDLQSPEELAGAVPLLSINIDQLKDVAIPYLATLLPISKATVTFAHTNADAFCKELLFVVEHQQERLADRKKAFQELMLSVQNFTKHIVVLPAPTLQSALKNPKTKFLLQEMAKKWEAIETISLDSYPAASCPLTNKLAHTLLADLHIIASDIWAVAKTTGTLTKPLRPITIKEKAFLVASVNGVTTALVNLMSRSFDIAEQRKEETVKLIEGLGAVLKDEALYKELITAIDQSSRATEEEKFFDAISILLMQAEKINSASIDQLQQTFNAYNEKTRVLLQEEQTKLAINIMKLQQVIFDLFLAKRSAQ